MNWLYELHQRHERLKHFVHNGMRYPLPPWGQKVMGLVYFSIPVFLGYHVMQWAISKAPTAIEMEEQEGVYGNKRVTKDGREILVGAGGWGGGVNLATNDAETSERSSESLKRYMRQLKRQQQRQQKQNQSENTMEESPNPGDSGKA